MTATPEQVKRLCAASGADEIAALSALERRNGDLLEALLELERQGSARPPARGGLYTTRPQGSTGPASALPVANAGGRRTGGWRRTQEDLSPPGLAAALRDLARRSVENYLEIRRRGRRVTSMPLLILLLLLVFFFWITALVLALGLVLGFRYRFGGPDLDRETMDRATARLSSKAAAVRDKIRAALQGRGRGRRR